MNKYQQKVLDYYNSLESKLGYKYFIWETKHFGFYPSGKPTISERKAQELMQDLIATNLSLKSSDLVLDAGCGYGNVALYLTNKYHSKIVGIDINSYEINKARKKTKHMDLADRATFEVVDYANTNFSDNYFDAIYTMETLSHAPNLSKTLKEFLRLLKPGGKIALFEYTLVPNDDFSSTELKMLELGIEGTAALGLKQFRHDRFPIFLRQIGFTNTKEQNITKNFLPSIGRLRKLAYIPYQLIKLFKLQKHFTNTLVAVEWYELVKKGLIRYCIFTAQKPLN